MASPKEGDSAFPSLLPTSVCPLWHQAQGKDSACNLFKEEVETSEELNTRGSGGVNFQKPMSPPEPYN